MPSNLTPSPRWSVNGLTQFFTAILASSCQGRSFSYICALAATLPSFSSICIKESLPFIQGKSLLLCFESRCLLLSCIFAISVIFFLRYLYSLLHCFCSQEHVHSQVSVILKIISNMNLPFFQVPLASSCLL